MKVAGRISPKSEALQSQRHHALGSPPAAHWQWRAWASGALSGFFGENPVPRKKRGVDGCGGSPTSSSSSKQRDVSWVPKSRRLLFFGRFQSSTPPWRIFGSLENAQHSRSWWTKNHGKHQIFISLWMAKPWVSCHFSPWNQNII